MKKIVLLFFLALALRLIMTGVWISEDRGRLSSDSQSYYDIAVNLAEGRGFLNADGVPTARRPPLYPALMALLLRTGLPFPLSIQLFQAFIGAACVVLLFLTGKQIFGERAGFWASLLLAVDYDSIRATVSVMSEPLFVFLLAAAYFCWYRAAEKDSKGFFFLSGICAGLSLLTRDVLIFFFPLAALWFFSQSKIRFFLLGLILPVLPWTARNIFVFKKLCLITITAGYTFYLANNIYATGGRTGGEWEMHKDTRYPVGIENVQLEDTSAEDQYLMKQGFKFIFENPGQFFELSVKKIINTWRPFQTDARPLTKWLQGITYCVIMLLAAAGIYQSRERWRELLPIYGLFAYLFLLHAVLISGIRYRFPVMPFFMLFAGFALSRKEPAYARTAV